MKRVKKREFYRHNMGHLSDDLWDAMSKGDLSTVKAAEKIGIGVMTLNRILNNSHKRMMEVRVLNKIHAFLVEMLEGEEE